MIRKADPSKPRIRRTSPAASRVVRPKRAVRTHAAGEAAPYHHGALREALLEAAERVLERDGLAGLTLRAVAREAGVSHAAPTHHFGDLTGLVSELAAIGYLRFNAAMGAAVAAANSPTEKALASGRAYVAYAQDNPGMYSLMFRAERLDHTRPALRDASEISFARLAGAIAANRQEPIAEGALSIEQAAAIARAWSLVHGYTMLLLDGRLTDILRRSPAGTTAEVLLDAMLKGGVTKPPR